mgnify:CR=1 FL=1|tara:strand:+ start:24708 stop:25376 length:669 start_codon:yes stop_codon:yes gene_type:complete
MVEERKNLLFFLGFVLISFLFHIFDNLFLFKYSFKIIEVFFHEFSHFLTALLSDGSIKEFHLRLGSGHVIYESRSTLSIIVTSLSGYIGASIFGFLIFFASLRYYKIILPIISLFPLSVSFFSSDFISFFSLLFLSGFFAIIGFFSYYSFVKYLLQFIGIFIMVSAIYSPTYLWYYNESGDHVLLANNTFIPSFIFIVIWFIISVGLLYYSFKILMKKYEKK